MDFKSNTIGIQATPIHFVKRNTFYHSKTTTDNFKQIQIVPMFVYTQVFGLYHFVEIIMNNNVLVMEKRVGNSPLLNSMIILIVE